MGLGVPAQKLMPALIGEGRAEEIVVNVLLPMAVVMGDRKALELYRGYPRLETNTLERHMRQQLGIDGKIVHSARRQQGLLHIYKTLCSHGKCSECPLAFSTSFMLYGDLSPLYVNKML